MRSSIFGPYRFLNHDEMEKLHAAALRILAEVGVRIPDDRLLNLAEGKGALVNHGDSIARFPKKLVELYIEENANAYRATKLEEQFPKKDDRKVHFSFGGQAVRTFDLDTCQIRDATLKDMENACSVASALDEVTYNAGLYKSNKVPPLTDDLYSYHTLVSHTNKPVFLDIMHLHSIPYLEEMAVAIHGSKQAVQEKKIIHFNAYICSPLQYPKDAIEKMWQVYDRGYTVSMGWPMTVAGGNAPITLAASAVSCIADSLSGIILTRMINPDTVACLGAAPITLDMSTGVGLYADPRKLVLGGALMDMSRFYGMPCGNFHIGLDAGFPGIQAAAERVFTAMATLAYWDKDIHVRLGCLGPSGAVACLAQVFIDLEIGRMIDKLLDGIEVTDETIAVDEIIKGGVAANFLDHDLTLKYFRKESFLPELFQRRLHEGRIPDKDPTYEKARVKAKKVIAETNARPLDTDVQNQIDTILKKAVKAVAP